MAARHAYPSFGLLWPRCGSVRRNDLWELIQAGAKADSDETFAAIFQRAHECVTEIEAQRANAMAMKLTTILDQKLVAQLFMLIEQAASQAAT